MSRKKLNTLPQAATGSPSGLKKLTSCVASCVFAVILTASLHALSSQTPRSPTEDSAATPNAGFPSLLGSTTSGVPISPWRSMAEHFQLASERTATDITGQGNWCMPNSSWLFNSSTVSSAELNQLLTTCPTSSGSQSPEHTQLLDLIPTAFSQTEQLDGCTVRSLNYADVRLAVYSESSQARVLLAARLATRTTGEQWQLITLTPKEDRRPNSAGLLPLDGSAQLVCQRSDMNGRLMCEVWQTQETLPHNWKRLAQAGWSIEAAEAVAGSPSLTWNCCRGEERIQVRSQSHPNNSTVTLIVTDLQTH